MKIIILLMLCSLFTITSCKNKKAATEAPEESNKIQKNSAFKAACQSHHIIKCKTGNPACGTKPGEGELKVYCIDGNDIILSNQPICGITEEANDHSAHCTQLTETSPDQIRIVSVDTHIPVCTNILDNTVSVTKPKCRFGNGKVICGTSPDNITVTVYCVDENNLFQGDNPTCKSSPNVLLSPKCKVKE